MKPIGVNSQPHASPSAAAGENPRRYLILAICTLSVLMVTMDGSIVNVALTVLRTDLHASVSGLQWIIDGYVLMLASTVMLSGSIADRVGRRRVFLTGLATFTAFSALCSAAPNTGLLIAFRALQGLGGSMLTPVAMSIVINVFTEPRERARAMGLWGISQGISIALGPIIGGVLIDTLGWRSIFWINVPVGIIAIALVRVFVPESRAERPRRQDPVGQVAVLAALTGFTFAIIEYPHTGWLSGPTLTALVIGVSGLAAVVIYEPRRSQPLIELRFFRSLPFSGAFIVAIFAVGAYSGFMFLASLYLQGSRAMTPTDAALTLIPMALIMMISGPLAGRVLGAYGPRAPLVIAGSALFAGALMFLDLRPSSSLPHVIATFVFFGVGASFTASPTTNAAASGMPNSQAGVAAGLASTARLMGNAIGVAVIGSVFNSGLGSASVQAGFTSAVRPGLWVIAGCGLVTIVLAIATNSASARATTNRVRYLFEEPNTRTTPRHGG